MKKFKLKVPKYSFDHESMIIQGKLRSCEHEVEVYAIDLCYDNMDIMSKMDIRQCMFKGNDFTWRYELDKFVQKQGAKYICRDKSGLLNLFDEVPRSDGPSWVSRGRSDYFDNFTGKLFQFVKWEDKKYYVIEDVLNNCEVVEDD
jgi:hypothetical protein